MPIKYPVSPRSILLCDYDLGGFREPEMIKKRPVVVLSARLPHRDGLCSVVPLSGTAPDHDVAYVVRIDLPIALPHPFEQKVWWAKCDMIATVAFRRLDLFRTGRDASGLRKYIEPKLSPAQYAQVMQGVLNGLGMRGLTFTGQ